MSHHLIGYFEAAQCHDPAHILPLQVVQQHVHLELLMEEARVCDQAVSLFIISRCRYYSEPNQDELRGFAASV